QHPAANRACPKGSAYVAPSLVPREPPLRPDRLGTLQQGPDRQLPAAAQLACEPGRWMVAAPQAAVPVRRDERERLAARSGHPLRYNVTRKGGETAQTALLPGGDEQTDARVVGDGGAGGAERDPAARALAAARHGPRDRGTAARADGRGEPRQGACAARA